MAAVLDRHNRGLALVVPIFVRTSNFEETPIAALQGIPRDAVPIETLSDPGSAIKTVASEIREVATRWMQQKSKLHEHLREPAHLVKHDATQMRAYYETFLRPAFTAPCIFEGSLLNFAQALDSLTEALGTGVVRNRHREIVREVASRAQFRTNAFRRCLDQVVALLALCRATVNRTVSTLETMTSSPVSELGNMEFALGDAIRRGARPKAIARVIQLMDEIDGHRNAIIRILNFLFELSKLPTLAPITLSSSLLRASRAMDATNLTHSWDIYYLRSNAEILDHCSGGQETGGAADHRQLARHLRKMATLRQSWSGEMRKERASELINIAKSIESRSSEESSNAIADGGTSALALGGPTRRARNAPRILLAVGLAIVLIGAALGWLAIH